MLSGHTKGGWSPLWHTNWPICMAVTNNHYSLGIEYVVDHQGLQHPHFLQNKQFEILQHVKWLIDETISVHMFLIIETKRWIQSKPKSSSFSVCMGWWRKYGFQTQIHSPLMKHLLDSIHTNIKSYRALALPVNESLKRRPLHLVCLQRKKANHLI